MIVGNSGEVAASAVLVIPIGQFTDRQSSGYQASRL
jgi:hypothetical protein